MVKVEVQGFTMLLVEVQGGTMVELRPRVRRRKA